MKRSRYLVRFDLGELPAGAVVTGAELMVQVTVANSSVCDYGVHRMLRDWAEGAQEGGNGSAATAGETTWLAQYYPDTQWVTPGGDYAATPSAATTMAGTGSTNYFTSEELAADVQHWLDSPELNFGWMIRAVDESVSQTVRRIASRETEGSGPVLIVRYRPPDSDADGVADPDDQCPGTAAGALVNATGCSLDQLVPCDAWANHGQYVAAFAAAANEFVRAGLLTSQQRAATLRVASQSDCGR